MFTTCVEEGLNGGHFVGRRGLTVRGCRVCEFVLTLVIRRHTLVICTRLERGWLILKFCVDKRHLSEEFVFIFVILNKPSSDELKKRVSIWFELGKREIDSNELRFNG